MRGSAGSSSHRSGYGKRPLILTANFHFDEGWNQLFFCDLPIQIVKDQIFELVVTGVVSLDDTKPDAIWCRVSNLFLLYFSDMTDLNLPKTCQIEYPDPDDLLNFKLIIMPDEVCCLYLSPMFTLLLLYGH